MADCLTNRETPLERVASEEADRPLPGTRAWFALFLLWMTALAGLALWAFARYEAGAVGVLPVAILALMGFYLSLCNALLPLPTAWIILYAASPDAGLLDNGWLRILAVAGAGANATMMANLNEYHVLTVLLRRRLAGRIRRTGVFQWAIRWFNKAPFQTLTLIGFVPIPVDAIRWLAILHRYPRLRFATAYFIGRGSRYVLFAGFSILAQLTGWQILAIQVAIVLLAALARLFWPRAGGPVSKAA